MIWCDGWTNSVTEEKVWKKTNPWGWTCVVLILRGSRKERAKLRFAISNQTIQSRLLPQAVASTRCSTWRGKKLHRASVSHQRVLNAPSLHPVTQSCWFPSKAGAYMPMKIQINMLFPVQAVHIEDTLKVIFCTREVCPSMDCIRDFT